MLPSAVSIHIGDEPLKLSVSSYSQGFVYAHIGGVLLVFESLEQLEARAIEFQAAVQQLKAERAEREKAGA